MPTIPIAKMIFNRHACLIALKDVTGEITTMSSNDMRTLAIALTQAEWATLKTALQHPEVWFAVEGVNDCR